MPKTSLIVAYAHNKVIGKGISLPWHIPADLKWFKEKTIGNTVIMGRKTYSGIGKALPDRLNIVLTSKMTTFSDKVMCAINIRDAINLAELNNSGKEIFFIGGESIYRQIILCVNTLYITEIYHDYTGDKHFPEVDLKNFKETERIKNYNPVPFDFITYKRK